MESGKIENIKISGFKSIKNVDIDLKPLNIIIGPNGTGKSNFIGAFTLLNKIVNKELQDFVALSGGADSFLHFGSKNTDKISITIDFGVNAYNINLIPAKDDKLVIQNELGIFRADKIGYSGGDKITNITNTISPESNLSHSGFSIESHISRHLNNYRIYHFHDTSKDAKVKKTTNEDDNIKLNTNASNLASMLYLFKEKYPHNYQNILNAIKLVAPFFKDFVLIPNDNGNILPRWKHKSHEKTFSFDDLSDGSLRFICLATLLLQPLEFLPDTILIDEPELGLHPHAISLIAEMFHSLAKQDKQIIASSQSVTFINHFTSQDILVADLKEDTTLIRRLEEDEVKEWLEEYELGEIWEKNIIGGTPGDF